VSQPVLPPLIPPKSAKKGLKLLNSETAGAEKGANASKNGGKEKGITPIRGETGSFQIGQTVYTHVGTTANGIEVCMSKELKAKSPKKRRNLHYTNSQEHNPGFQHDASIGTATLHQRMLQYYAPPTSSYTLTTTTDSPQYSPIGLVAVDLPPPKKVPDSLPLPKETLFAQYTVPQIATINTDNSAHVNPSLPTTPATYSSAPSRAPYTKKKSKKSTASSPAYITISTTSDNPPPAMPPKHYVLLQPTYNNGQTFNGVASTYVTTPPSYEVTAPVAPPSPFKNESYSDPLTTVKKTNEMLFIHPVPLDTGATIINTTLPTPAMAENSPDVNATASTMNITLQNATVVNTEESDTTVVSSAPESFVFILDQDIIGVTFSACPVGFPIEKPKQESPITTTAATSDTSYYINNTLAEATNATVGASLYINDTVRETNSSGVCNIGFTPATADNATQKNFTAHHNYELLIKAGQTAVDVQLIINSIETLMGGFVVQEVFNCTASNAYSRRFLYGNRTYTKTTSTSGSISSTNSTYSSNISDTGILISKYSLSPLDTEALTENCTQLHVDGNHTTCIVVNSSSIIYYSSNISASTKQNIEESIRQVFSYHCSNSNLSSIGVVKCAALPNPTIKKPSVTIKKKTTTPEAKIGSTGEEKSNGTAAPINSPQVTTQSQQAGKSVLSAVGTLMVVLSAMGIPTVLALFVLQKRKRVKETNRFCELEETEIADDVIVEKYGFDVEDKSVFTMASKAQSNQISLADETPLSKTQSRQMTMADESSHSLDGEKILEDLKLTEDNPVAFKHAGSYRPRIITEENGNIDVEEPFYLGRYETYTPTLRKTKMDDSVTL